MTYVKCGICKKEFPLKELKVGKVKNFLLCKNCYQNMQKQVSDGIMKNKNYEVEIEDEFEEPKTKKGFFGNIFSSIFGKKKEENSGYYDTKKDSPIKINEDFSQKRKEPIIVKDDPLIKRNKVQLKEDKVKYYCNKCRYRFKLKQASKIKLCPHCGSKDIEMHKDMDANELLNSVNDMI